MSIFDGAHFPPQTDQQWRALVEETLGGAPFASLISKTYDEIDLAPLYAPDAGKNFGGAAARLGPWDVFTRIDHPEWPDAIEQAKDDLDHGASGLHLVFARSPCAFGFGLQRTDRSEAGGFFDEVGSRAPSGLAIDCAASGDAEAASLLGDWGSHGLERGVRIEVGFDPVGASPSVEAVWPRLAETIVELRGRGWDGLCLCADARRINAAGGSEAQELAFALANALAWLRAMEREGVSTSDARDLLFFRISADADHILSLAKLRALRGLWEQIEAACGLAHKPARIAVESAWRMMTQRDPWTNVLRGAIACFSAALGGCDAMVVLPFTQALGLPDPFARRLARNTQLVLRYESHVEKVGDPAGGSGAFERITEDLSRRAWSLLQDIERHGGLGPTLAAGHYQNEVAATRSARVARIARRLEAIVGVSDHPDLAERTPGALARPASAREIEGGGDACFPMVRDAQPFERLRDQSDELLAATGARPRVLLVPLGAAQACEASLALAKTIFESGGIEALAGDEPISLDHLIEQFKSCGAHFACFCPPRAHEPALAVELIRALAKCGARLIYYAGQPGGAAAVLAQAGVADFIVAGCDACSILEGAHGCAA